MQKYTFICENSYDNSKITFESNAESLDQILNDFENFLRGSGFHINGSIDIVDTESNFVEENTNSFNIFDSWKFQSEFVDLTEKENFSLCPVCKIDTNTMKKNDCYDKNCPKVN